MPRLRRLAIVLPLLLIAAGSTAADEPISALRDAVAARLALMQDVARYKWNNALAVAAPAREAAVLDAVTQRAMQLGLPGDWARRVVAAQIEASRALQSDLFGQWRAARAGTFDGVPDLSTVQRPHIDAATGRLLEALAAACPTLSAPGAVAALAVPPPQLAAWPDVWSIAVAPLARAPVCG